jgi:geranylgeranyl diphosphate synthase type II
MIEIGWRFEPAVVETALGEILEAATADTTLPSEGLTQLREAMRYAVFSGGKRLRSQLLLEVAGVAGGAALQLRTILPAACALELIHSYSLVHDDLPAMDDADTRRGRPSCHKKYGEATAILVGDALLTLAFEVIAKTPTEHETSANGEASRALRAIAVLARAAGEAGMVGGQMIDIGWSSEHVDHVTGAELLHMHALKTGALIRAACEIGALLGGASPAAMQALRRYGECLGKAFQIHDDVLDIEGDPQLTGKAATDIANYKTTAAAVFGLESAKQLAREASEQAIAALQGFGPEADALRRLARFTVQRQH